MSTESHYDILEVPENATSSDIKKSYRRLSLLHHPDKNQGKIDISGKFQKINSAYEVIGDDARREEYDMERKSPFGQGAGGIDELIANLFFGGPRMGRGGGAGPQCFPQHQQQGFLPPNFSQVFGQQGFGQQGFGQHGFPPNANIKIFRNGTQMNFQQQMEKPSPIVKTVTITMEQVLMGGTVPIEIERWLIENNNKIFETEVLYVEIPKGVDDNEIISLKDKGNIVGEECKGDVKIFIKINNTSDFKRNGLDLIIEKHITLKEALCGFTFDLKYINGKNYTINNVAGNIIKPDFNKMIPGMGLERDGHRGGVVISFHVDFPDKLDEHVITKLRELL